ncbi:hypothetical protein [Oceanobacillus zhaokaii]|uniref:hypothetical protein n=1 Tax=Oceanobacillus zhaokaii TaxID=2052660 RepID=UPI0013B415C0|nr:hypothetical protein [Oceanobacillus zhaokaii]
MSKPVIRTYIDSSDLKRMQKLTQAIWTLESNYHIGDLAWQAINTLGVRMNGLLQFGKWMINQWLVDG